MVRDIQDEVTQRGNVGRANGAGNQSSFIQRMEDSGDGITGHAYVTNAAGTIFARAETLTLYGQRETMPVGTALVQGALSTNHILVENLSPSIVQGTDSTGGAGTQTIQFAYAVQHQLTIPQGWMNVRVRIQGNAGLETADLTINIRRADAAGALTTLDSRVFNNFGLNGIIRDYVIPIQIAAARTFAAGTTLVIEIVLNPDIVNGDTVTLHHTRGEPEFWAELAVVR